MHDPYPARGRSEDHPYVCLCGMRFETIHELRLHNGLLKTWHTDDYWGSSPSGDLANNAAKHKLVL